MKNVTTLTGMVSIEDIIEGLKTDLADMKSLAVVAELHDKTLICGHSSQDASDLALKALIIQDLAMKAAQR